jgi:type III pantothenate kinase
MNLCVDIGNTRTKIAIFDNEGSILKLIIKDEFIASKLEKLFHKYAIKNLIISSVKKKQGKFKRLFGSKLSHFIELSASTPIPIKNLYATPETLGKDRLAGVIGAASIFPNSDILVIDAGTCITYDWLTPSNEYLGGAISPGMHMRYIALHQQTGKLPLVSHESFQTPFGTSTIESILCGVQQGIIGEINHQIALFNEKYPQARVYITGGDALFLSEHIKSEIFVEPLLIHHGLFHALQYNEIQ